MKNGGYRPGSGAKSKETLDYQFSRLKIAQEVITPERWRKCCETHLTLAEQGNIDSSRFIAGYATGNPEKLTALVEPGETPTVRILVDYADKPIPKPITMPPLRLPQPPDNSSATK